MILVDTPSPIPESVASVGYAEHAEAIRNALNVVSTQKHSAPLEGCEDDFDAMEQDQGTWFILITKGLISESQMILKKI